MTVRGFSMVGMVLFVLLLALGSYLLDVPMTVVLIAAAFAIGVILWIGASARSREPR